MPESTPTPWNVDYPPVVLGDVHPPILALSTNREAPEPAERFSVLGVAIDNVTRDEAIEWLERVMAGRDRRTTSVYFVNAHTLNLAAADSSYRDVLNAADFVFADGTGVRWAARLQKVHVKQNMPGTDFVPEMFCAMSDRGRSYFMLGSDPDTIAVAADHARCAFPGWRQAGFCHGYLRDERLTRSVIEQINAARPDVLLVGMGNPLQEQWIHRHRAELNVPVCMGVGGLFDFWSGKVSRSPRWLRRAGHEWIWRLWQQPMSKARRYLIGNPLFLVRVLWERREK